MQPGRDKNTNCRICGGKDNRVHELQDYRLKISGKYRFIECAACGYGIIDPIPSPESLKALYEKYYPRNYSLHIPKKLFLVRKIANYLINSENLIYVVKEGKGRLLDIGCGFGDALVFFREKGFECHGIEIDSRAASFCREQGLKVSQQTTLDYLDFPDNYFDVIILAQVIEHIVNPDTLLREIKRILRPDGMVYITTPNFSSYLRPFFRDFWISGWFLPFHLHLFSEDSMKKYTGKFGFTVSSIYTKTPASWFNLCVKAFLYRNKEFSTEKRNAIMDSIPLQFAITPALKLLDMITGRGDCLFVVFRKG